MSEIKSPVNFSANAKTVIEQVKTRPGHSHTDWSNDELEPVRVEARNHYRAEQRFCCAYCQQPVSERSAAGAPVEHIANKASYPQFMFEPLNLCVTCPDCNEYKRNKEVIADPVMRGKAVKKYPKKTDRFRIFHPHFDKYDDHIKRAGMLYFADSPKGTYTMYVCHLQRFMIAVGLTEELLNSLHLVVERHRFHGGQ